MNGLQAVSHVSRTERSLSKDVIQALDFICHMTLVDKRPFSLTTLYSKLNMEVVGSPDKAIQLLAALLFLVGDVANIPANSLLKEFKLEKKSLMDFRDDIKLERCRRILTRGFYVRFCSSLSDPDKNQLLVTLCELNKSHHENYDLYKIFYDLEKRLIRYDVVTGIDVLAEVLNDEQFENIDKSFLMPREHAPSTDIGWYDTFSPNGSTLPSTLPNYQAIDQQYHNRDQLYQRYHSEPNNDITYSSQYSIPPYNPPSLPANIQDHFHSQVSYPSNPSPQGYSSNPSQGYSSNPQGYSSNPSQGYSSYPPQGYSSNPSQGYSSNPPQGYSSNPPQGYFSNPSQGYSNLPGYSSLESPGNPPQRYPHPTNPQYPSTPPGYISNPQGHSTSGTNQSKSLQRNIPPISQQQQFNKSFPPYGPSSSSSSGSSCSSNISVAPVSQFNLPPVANQYQPQPYQPQPGLATPTTTHYHTPHLRDTPSQYSSISPDRYSNDPSLASIPYYQYPVHPAGAASPQPFQGHNNVRDVASSNDHHRSNIAVRSNKPKPNPQSFS